MGRPDQPLSAAEEADYREEHHPSCCGACDTCLRVCWGYHGPERRATVRRQYDRNFAIELDREREATRAVTAEVERRFNDTATYDERRREVAEMIEEADRQDDHPMGPDGLADALMDIALGWLRAALRAPRQEAECGFEINLTEAAYGNLYEPCRKPKGHTGSHAPRQEAEK